MDLILYLNNSWPYIGNLKDFEAKHICENPNLICQNIQKNALKNSHKGYRNVVLKFEFQVSCLMDANPANDLTFKWKFNTTANTVDIPVRTLKQNIMIFSFKTL